MKTLSVALVSLMLLQGLQLVSPGWTEARLMDRRAEASFVDKETLHYVAASGEELEQLQVMVGGNSEGAQDDSVGKAGLVIGIGVIVVIGIVALVANASHGGACCGP